MKSSPSYNSTMMVNAMGSNNGSVKNASSFLIEPSSTSSPQLTTSQQAPKLIKFNAQELDAANKPSAMFQSGAKNLNNLFKIEKELSDLTLTIEKEMEKANDCYYGQCRKCNKPVYGRGNACQALNSIFHVECFGCTSCGRLLRGKPFYCLNNNSSQIYCEEDYLYSGFLENAQKCAHCQQLIVDKILQALGKSYHPNCFRCFSCNHSLDGLPFTLDIHSRVYCLNDYFRYFIFNSINNTFIC